MSNLQEAIFLYRDLLEKEQIKIAYTGILDFMKTLRKRMEEEISDCTFSNGIFEGRMDFTYFHFTSSLLKKHKLKIVVLFVHESLTFEVLLSGLNRKIQAEYWKRLKDQKFNRYRYANNPNTEDYILGETITDNPDFNRVDKLEELLLKKTISFNSEINGIIIKF